MTSKLISLKFNSLSLLKKLFGKNEEHLAIIEQKLGISISVITNEINISGEHNKVMIAKMAIEHLYACLEKGRKIDGDEVVASLIVAENSFQNNKSMENRFIGHDFVIKTRKKNIIPYSQNQLKYIQLLQKKEVILTSGPASTGKTYLAVAVAFSLFLNRLIDKIILTIPMNAEKNELDSKSRFNPHLRPLYDSLHDMISHDSLNRCIESGEIEIAPLNHLKGRNLSNAFIILDEAENASPEEVKECFTHLGESSKIAVIGRNSKNLNGLNDAKQKLAELDEVAIIEFSNSDIIVNPLTAKILKAYGKKLEEVES